MRGRRARRGAQTTRRDRHHRPALLVVAAVIGGGTGQISAGILTAFGCSTLGMGLVRLIPRRYMLIGVLCMCAIDVALLVAGVGQPAAAQMTRAGATSTAPCSTTPRSAPSRSTTRTSCSPPWSAAPSPAAEPSDCTAILVTLAAAAYGLLLPIAGILPATVPPAVAFTVMGKAARVLGRGEREPRDPRDEGPLAAELVPQRSDGCVRAPDGFQRGRRDREHQHDGREFRARRDGAVRLHQGGSRAVTKAWAADRSCGGRIGGTNRAVLIS
jgi:hypothetical protein